LDTAGIDDSSELGEMRIARAKKILLRADIAFLLVESGIWTDFEESLVQGINDNSIPLIIIINKSDISAANVDFLNLLMKRTRFIASVSSIEFDNREKYIKDIKECLQKALPREMSQPLALVGDLLPPGGLAVFVVPIDLQAPKGRLILPQVQSIRDILDNDASVVVVKEREYPYLLTKLKDKPDLVVCDSQVVQKMVADTPLDVKCTTFSILFSRFKGDLVEEARGAAVIDLLTDGDKILIAESCSHHALEDDIGRVKIPRWLRQYIGSAVEIEHYSGHDYPENLKDYKVVIHCGGCMLTRTEKLMRIRRAKEAGVPITNYGVVISKVQGVLERVLSPFPAALEAYKSTITGKN
jgi:[FeFe] hydrogenase H-cluster maturation GTPase HydF